MPITQEELARRLRAAREACHLKQEDAARHLGVSRPTFSQLELGNRAVTSLELDKLAYLYGRGISELLAEGAHPGDTIVALFRLHPEFAGREAVFAALRESMARGRELSNLEHLLGIERDRAALPVYPVRPAKSRWEAIRQGEQAALDERRRLQLVDAPLLDVAELLESQGVRTAQLELPEDLSGLTLFDDTIGPFVVVNNHLPSNSGLRRRFSLSHEYCHVLLDRDLKGTLSLTSDKENHLEVRANAFAAAFLMPAGGAQDFVRCLGKGRDSRLQSVVYDEVEAQVAQARPEPRTQTIQMHDVVLLAHHFGVSRQTAIYRLKNLGLINATEVELLKKQDQEGQGRSLAAVLGLSEPEDEQKRREFHHRFIALALEAFRRDEITRSKLGELAAMVDVSPKTLDGVLAREHPTSGEQVPDSISRE